MAFAIGAETEAPKPFGCFSTTTETTKRGLFAGAKNFPTVHFTFYLGRRLKE